MGRKTALTAQMNKEPVVCRLIVYVLLLKKKNRNYVAVRHVCCDFSKIHVLKICSKWSIFEQFKQKPKEHQSGHNNACSCAAMKSNTTRWPHHLSIKLQPFSFHGVEMKLALYVLYDIFPFSSLVENTVVQGFTAFISWYDFVHSSPCYSDKHK